MLFKKELLLDLKMRIKYLTKLKDMRKKKICQNTFRFRKFKTFKFVNSQLAIISFNILK